MYALYIYVCIINICIGLGSISQATNSFFNIRSDFSILINYYQELSLFAAGIDRLYTFLILLG